MIDSHSIDSVKLATARILNQILDKLISRWTVRRFLRKSYHLTKAYKYVRLHLNNLERKKSLLVYQMGKVGSSTTVRSLRSLDLDMHIYQIHVLTNDCIRRVEKTYKNASKVHDRAIIDQHLLESIYLRKQLDKGLKGEKWKVVTLIREPIARNISCFFEAFNQYFPDVAIRYKIEAAKMEDRIEELIEVFLQRFKHETPLIWFDVHMKPVFGIDVFSSDFPKSKGYKIYNGENADLLLIRFENINQCSANAFREFLNIEDFALINANISSNKPYSLAYQKFLENIVLPDDYVNKMYTSTYVQHFYSEEEINRFRVKWRKTSFDNPSNRLEIGSSDDSKASIRRKTQ